jgi:hypothetical protein
MADLVESGPGDAGVGEDKFRLIVENVVLSIVTRSNPQPIREPGDVVEILKLAASFSRLPPLPTDHKACLMR